MAIPLFFHCEISAVPPTKVFLSLHAPFPKILACAELAKSWR